MHAHRPRTLIASASLGIALFAITIVATTLRPNFSESQVVPGLAIRPRWRLRRTAGSSCASRVDTARDRGRSAASRRHL